MSQANQRFRDDRNFHKDSYYHNRERTHYNKHEGNYQKERKNSCNFIYLFYNLI